jgi:pyridoxine/pyridoxamine 5'-phosphate oxidase
MVMREGKPDDATRARMAQIGASAVEQQKAIAAAVDEAALRRWCVEMAAKFPQATVETARDIYSFVTGESA